jgi:predicted small secreted protein
LKLQHSRGCTVQSVNERKFMTKNLAIWVLVLSALILSSCDTPVGQGAAWGAATGAIIGGAATGNVRAASIGAAAGAAAGALTGKIVEENQAARYGPPPPGGYPYARWAGTPGFYYSPYTGRVYDLRGVPHGGLTRDVDSGGYFRKP